MTKSPRIETNEGGPAKTIRIVANVIQRPDSTYPVIVKPYKLDISQFGDKVRSEIKFLISNVSPQDLTVTLAAGAPGHFEVDLPKKIAAHSDAEGILTVRKDMLNESFEKSFTFEVNDEQLTRFTVPVRRILNQQAAGETPGTTGE